MTTDSTVRGRLNERSLHWTLLTLPKVSTKPSLRSLSVMKFGGTSVGDASCIARVVDIIRAACPTTDLVVVVSAMRGVTDDLIRAARSAVVADYATTSSIFDALRHRHQTACDSIVPAGAVREQLRGQLSDLLAVGRCLCHATTHSGTLLPQALDAISGLGERLAAPLVAAALAVAGLLSETVEATELIVTDSCHGDAEPLMEITSFKCQARLREQLHRGCIPVVTGFIGATAQGTATTLGRGGSDYSATILGAALDADEVVIWTDVDGVMTADPRQNARARTIPELSYQEAARMAQAGAKVLHPKSLSPVVDSGIPIWVRNTFAPHGPATKITAKGAAAQAAGD